jgi:hypothetical protein
MADFSGEDRAVTGVSYVAVAAVILVFLGGLTAAYSAAVEDSAENVAEVEADRVSEEVAVAITDVDRIAEQNEAVSGDTGKTTLTVALPEDIGTRSYIVRVDSNGVVTVETTGVGESIASSTVDLNGELTHANSVDGVSGVAGGSTLEVTYTGNGTISISQQGERFV